MRLWTLNILLGLLVAMPLSAKKTAPTMSVEQEQQFLYYYYAAQHADEQHDYPRALLLFDFCAQINPNDALVNDRLGALYYAVDKTDEAVSYFKKAYELSPSEHGEHYLNYLLDSAQWKQALKVQNKIDSYNGYTSTSALNRYRIYIGQGKGKQAVAEIDRYLEKDPESLNFLLFRADIHAHLGEDQQVFELSRRIAKLMPLSGVEYEQIKMVPYCAYYVSHLITYDADSLMNIGQIQQAYMYYEIAMYLWPKNLTAINNYADGMATHGGDLSRAEKMSATTIQAEPDNAVFLDTYAWILYLKGQNTLAEFYLKKALEKARRDEVKEVVVEHLKEVRGEK